MIPQNTKIIAVDFDGTIVDDQYPSIGKPRTFAFETLKKLQEDGHRLILWTYRNDRSLEDAIEFCKKNGIEFYAVNKNYPEEIYNEKSPRKLHADLFIDDRNVGGFMGWGKIYQIISNKDISDMKPPKKKSLFGGILKR